jgi:hypothetical protein
MVTRSHVESWVSDYEQAWRTPGTALLRDLFSDDASYRQAPYDVPKVGVDEIAAMWETEREGPDEVFSMSSEIVAVEGDTAVVRVRVPYGDPVTQEYLDLWVIRFDEEGRCVAFEEWPFWPEHGSSPG